MNTPPNLPPPIESPRDVLKPRDNGLLFWPTFALGFGSGVVLMIVAIRLIMKG